MESLVCKDISRTREISKDSVAYFDKHDCSPADKAFYFISIVKNANYCVDIQKERWFWNGVYGVLSGNGVYKSMECDLKTMGGGWK